MRKTKVLPFIFLVFAVNFGFGQNNFKYAQPGEYWIILDDNVAVMRTPEAATDRTAFNHNLVIVIGKNTKVKILDSKGWLSVWHKVNVLSDDGVLATGWILTEVVKSAKKSSRTESKTVSSKWGLIRFAHSTVNIRASRSASSKVVSQLKPNQKIKVDFLKGNWSAVFDVNERVRTESNAIGYVYSSLLYPAPKIESKKTRISKNLLSFKIVKKEDHSYPGTSRMTYRVLLNVTKIPQEQEIKDVAFSLWQDDNKSWKEFTVFLYLTEMDTDDIAYGIANFTPSGLKDFNINEFALWDTKWEKK